MTFRFLPALFTSVTACFLITGTAQANEQCEQIIFNSDSMLSTLEARGESVRHCLDLVHETRKAAYRNSFPMCRDITLASSLPTTIQLPDGRNVTPNPGRETWEELALRIGTDAMESGCRDGILSALQQTFFVNSEQVRQVFEDTSMEMEDVLVEQIPLPPVGTLHVEKSRMRGEFLNSSGIAANQSGVVHFTGTPFQLEGEMDGSLETFLGWFPVASWMLMDGTVGGTLDGRTLQVTINSSDVTKITLSDSTPYRSLLEQLIRNNINERAEDIRAEFSSLLTARLREAYAGKDPFLFLRELEE